MLGPNWKGRYLKQHTLEDRLIDDACPRRRVGPQMLHRAVRAISGLDRGRAASEGRQPRTVTHMSIGNANRMAGFALINYLPRRPDL